MLTEQLLIDEGAHWLSPPATPIDAQLVLAFAGSKTLESQAFVDRVRARYPNAHVVTVSAPDNIAGTHVLESGGSVTAVRFDQTAVRAAAEDVAGRDDSERAGEALAQKLPTEGLKHVLVFSEGLNINGTALLRGLKKILGRTVSLSGGLASDGEAFQRTIVGLDELPRPDRIVAVGLYGDAIRIGKGSLGGWVPFGNDMTISRSVGNTVYELNGRPALGVYREVLGSRAYGLPAAGLFFPLNIQSPDGGDSLVRTLLSIDEPAGSVTFAGDVPEGYTAHLMHTNLDRLVDASATAASFAALTKRSDAPAASLVLLISCIGRKLLLQRRSSEEVSAAREKLGADATYAGFYSYGEISPMNSMLECQLQNQTLTITTISESAA